LIEYWRKVTFFALLSVPRWRIRSLEPGERSIFEMDLVIRKLFKRIPERDASRPAIGGIVWDD